MMNGKRKKEKKIFNIHNFKTRELGSKKLSVREGKK